MSTSKRTQLKLLEKELDRLMPRVYGWQAGQYSCRLCGAQVTDRIVHWRWHRGADMVDILTKLFGRPN